MAMTASDIERLIRASIPDADVTIRDLAGDGDHYAATVIAESFRGKSRVQQHQLVYAALKGRMGGELHALPRLGAERRNGEALFAGWNKLDRTAEPAGGDSDNRRPLG